MFFSYFFHETKIYIYTINQNINHVDEVYYIYLSINAHMRMYKTTITLLYKVKDIILTPKNKIQPYAKGRNKRLKQKINSKICQGYY